MNKEIDIIELKYRSEEYKGSVNFRIGDIVATYTYDKDTTPDIRKSMLHRGTIIDIDNEKIAIKLRNTQLNRNLYKNNNEESWAIEHDFIDSSFSTLYRSLYSFICANEKRKRLLLGIDYAQIESKVAINGDYSIDSLETEHNQIVTKAKQAKDYFILIGPPGTGKTSFGMLNILKEELTEEGTNILVTAYTNRAVDEICDKLVKENIDFSRIGSQISSDERFHNCLMQNKMNEYSDIESIREYINSTRVFVGTTTAINSTFDLLKIKKFETIIIDEASQILEPQIIGILSAKHNDGTDSIKKFIMIGDHKQLPAVSLQQREDTKIESEELRNLGFTDCCTSLFERLLKVNKNEKVVHHLTKQGRMHKDVAKIPNEMFYEGKLKTIPLPHQEADLEKKTKCKDQIEDIVYNRRFAFISCIPKEINKNNKINTDEARIIARIVKEVWNKYKQSEKIFDKNTIGIIVPYRNQIEEIKKYIREYKIEELNEINIDTVERYQGSQRDIIIYGTTISKTYQLKFLTASRIVENNKTIDRKLNVALTRAKEQTFVIGNKSVLEQDNVYREMIEKANSYLL